MWYNNSWTYRIKITIDRTKVPSNQSNFPIFVDLSGLPTGFFNRVKSDGGDIRVTTSDGVTECPREIVSINTSSRIGELHFKAPSVSSASNSEFYIYYGNSSASEPAANATYGSQNVWDSNFLAVYHMDNANDSTSNIRHMTGVSSPTFTTGKMGNGAVLNNGPYFTIPGSSWLAIAEMHIQLWHKTSANSTQHFLIADNGGGGATVTFRVNTSTEAQFRTMTGGGTGLNINPTGLSSHADGNWHNWVGKWKRTDGSPNGSIFKDGSSIGTGNEATSTPDAASNNFYVGSYFNGSQYKIDGMLDELRISNLKRTDDWDTTVYNNQNSPATFYSISGEQGRSVGSMLQMFK